MKHLNQGYDMFSFNPIVENKHGFGAGGSWEAFVVIWVRNDGGLNITTVGRDKRAQIPKLLIRHLETRVHGDRVKKYLEVCRVEKGDNLFCFCTEGLEGLMGTKHWEIHFNLITIGWSKN